MQKILEGVRRFQEVVFPAKREFFEKLAREQRPRALFIACSDSRVHPNLITQTEPGDLFILRNPGNIVPAYRVGNDSESATIEYAVEVLKVEDIIVCGHSNCGAMTALLRQTDVEKLPAVAGWLNHAEGTRRVVEARHNDLPFEERVEHAIAQNALAQLDHLRTHPAVAAAASVGTLNLHAWVYNIATGEVSHYMEKTKRFESLVHGREQRPVARAGHSAELSV